MRSSFKLSEDWLATGIGLLLVLIVGSGITGPGPQKVSLTAVPGESTEQEALAIDGWAISGKIDGQTTTAETLPTDLIDGQTYFIVCANDSLSLETSNTVTSEPSSDHALLILQNQCDAEVSLTYSTDYFVRWPIFGLFE